MRLIVAMTLVASACGGSPQGEEAGDVTEQTLTLESGDAMLAWLAARAGQYEGVHVLRDEGTATVTSITFDSVSARDRLFGELARYTKIVVGGKDVTGDLAAVQAGGAGAVDEADGVIRTTSGLASSASACSGSGRICLTGASHNTHYSFLGAQYHSVGGGTTVTRGSVKQFSCPYKAGLFYQCYPGFQLVNDPDFRSCVATPFSPAGYSCLKINGTQFATTSSRYFSTAPGFVAEVGFDMATVENMNNSGVERLAVGYKVQLPCGSNWCIVDGVCSSHAIQINGEIAQSANTGAGAHDCP